jgi:integrase
MDPFINCPAIVVNHRLPIKQKDGIQIQKQRNHLNDTRHTFITVGRNYMDKLLLQKFVGHKPDDITDKVYTHIQFSELLTAINQIKRFYFC